MSDDPKLDMGYLLTDYADGQLAPEGVKFIEEQLASRPELRERLGQIRTIQAVLRKGLGQYPPPAALQADRRAWLLRKIQNIKRQRLRILAPKTRWVIAAMLVLSIGMVSTVMIASAHWSIREQARRYNPSTASEMEWAASGHASVETPPLARDASLVEQQAARNERDNASRLVAPTVTEQSKEMRLAPPALGASAPAGFPAMAPGFSPIPGGPPPTGGSEPMLAAKGERPMEALGGHPAYANRSEPAKALAGARDGRDRGRMDDRITDTKNEAKKSTAEEAPLASRRALTNGKTGAQVERTAIVADGVIKQVNDKAKMNVVSKPMPQAPAAPASKPTIAMDPDAPMSQSGGREEAAGEGAGHGQFDQEADESAISHERRQNAAFRLDVPSATTLPPIAQPELFARLQGQLVPLPPQQVGFGTLLEQVAQQARIPLRGDDGQLIQGALPTRISNQTGLVAGESLVRIARSANLQLHLGTGVVELQQPRHPLDPATTFGLTSDQFRTAFGSEPMRAVREHAQHTVALDAGTASFDLAKAQAARGQAIEPVSIRAEQFINAMPQDYPAATGPEAFALYAEAAPSPFPVAYPISSPISAPQARGQAPVLVAVGVVGRAAAPDERRPLHLTLALDVSGSMAQTGGLSRIKLGLRTLAQQLSADDRVAVVAFADQATVVLPATAGDQPQRIIDALAGLSAHGSTNAVEGLALAYQVAAEGAGPGIESRVVFASDGAALAGDGAQAAIDRARAWRGKGVSLLVLGCGDERNASTALEELAARCDGQHEALATDEAAIRTFAERLVPQRLSVLARDAKLQVTWNPERVAYARLIGFDQRRLKDEDFRNDAVDAGELNHESRLTALFEIIPTDAATGPLGSAAVRYYDTRQERVRELACPMPGAILASVASPRLRLLAAAAETAEWLHQGWWSNVRLPDPERIRAVLATCPQEQARALEAMIRVQQSALGR